MSDLDDIAALVYGTPVDPEQRHLDQLAQAVQRLRKSIDAIKEGIATDNLSRAAEAWYELTNEERESIWVAPTRNVKGKRVLNEHAPFTTREREIIRSPEFSKSYFGEGS